MHTITGHRQITRAAVLVIAAIFCSACATSTPVTSAPTTATRSAGGASQGGTARSGSITVVPQSAPRWPVRTEAHVDLWLHAFAVISTDGATIPLFKRGYRDSVSAEKSRNNVLTSLDANRETLAKRLATNPSLVEAQFLALSFNNFPELKFATEKFLQYQGEAKRASDATTSQAVAQFATVFKSAADREWLRLFMLSISDEQSRFYDAEYEREVRERQPVVNAVDSIWHKVYQAKFERFLNNTSQRQGAIVLSLPLGGEGRTAVGKDRQTVVAVPFPARSTDAVQAVLVLAHEVVGNLVLTVVADNTTPAQQRSGEAVNFTAFGQVHGGLLLLQKVAPELAEPYARYYLAQGGKPLPATNAAAALRAAFPMPQAVIDGLTRQIDIVLAGI